MSIAVSLGEEVTRDGKVMRCVRFTKQTSLFQGLDGTLEVLEEDLIEFKGRDGSIDFEVMVSNRVAYDGPLSTIKAPEPILWRKD